MKIIFDFKREYNIYCEERGLGKRITNQEAKRTGKKNNKPRSFI